MGRTHSGAACRLLTRCLPALADASESPGPGPRALARASTGRNRMRPSHPSRSFWVGPTPGPLARAGRIRVAGLGERRRRPVCRLHALRPARRRGCPARAGPAARPEHLVPYQGLEGRSYRGGGGGGSKGRGGEGAGEGWHALIEACGVAWDRARSDGSSACQWVAGPAPAQLPIYGPEKRHGRWRLVGITSEG